ncbi:MAG TPA: sporulation protein, partial [Dielma fastidiosa]|nr:sporulation protein [Dielma fastidiosa]
YLAIALSIDSLASGFALGISIVQPLPVLIISFCIGILAILCGSFLGSRMLSLKECRLSWLSGVLFLILAFSRIL